MTYTQVLFILDIHGDSIEFVTDDDGDLYKINHDKHTFQYIWDYDAMNTIMDYLYEIEDYSDLCYAESQMVNAIYEDMEDNPEGFWRLYTHLHLDRFNQDLFDEHFEKDMEA